MITLITGVPGSGKSQYAVKLILDAIQAKEDAIKQLPKLEKEGDQNKIEACKALIRDIYTDIAGFDHERIGTKESPPDWRDTPDGSLVVYDECQEHFGPDGQGRAKNPQIQALEKHRHSGHDLIFITQRERLLHAHIRDLVGRHYHIQRQYGTHNVKIYRRDETIDTKSRTLLESCDNFLWRYEKRLFDCYKSATVHTHKAALPTWLKSAAFGLVLAVLAMLFLGYKAFSFFSGKTVTDGAQAAAGVQVAEVRHDPLVVEVTRGRRPINGCVIWAQETECRCHDIDGRTVDSLSFDQCMIHARGSTLNFSSSTGYEKRGREAPEAKARSSGGPSSAPSASVVM